MDKNQVQEFQEKGYTKVAGFFTPQEVAEINRHVQEYVDGRARELSGRDINFSSGVPNSIHKLWNPGEKNFFNTFAASEKLMELVRPFLNDDPELRASELFLKPAKVGLPSPHHQDNFYWCLDDANGLTVWVALVPCGPENGGIFYYEGSHKMGILAHKDSFAPGSSQTVKDLGEIGHLKKVVPSLVPGDVLLHHSLTVHGSDANTSDFPRKGWTIQYKAKSSVYNKDMLNHYNNRLAEQVKAREERR